MSNRLQVILSGEEMATLRKHAETEDLSIGEYVRRVLREAALRHPSRKASTKLASIREAALHAFPTGDIDQMNREIQQGYRS